MTWTLHLANASGSLDGLTDPITASVEDVRQRAETVMPAIDLDVVIQAWPGRVIEHLGFAGYAPTGWMIQLTFDPGNPAYASNLGEPLRRTIAHELHHVMRWRGPGYGRTLGEALVTEGLAGHFAGELYGRRPERWESSLDDQQLRRAAAEADAVWEARYNHAEWFFGTGSRAAWTGYTLGYALVERHLKEHPSETASSLVAESAEDFRHGLRSLSEDREA